MDLEAHYEYDKNGNLIRAFANNGEESIHEYDERGNEIHYVDSNGWEEWKEYEKERNKKMKMVELIDKFLEENHIHCHDKSKEKEFKDAIRLIATSCEIYRGTLGAIRSILIYKEDYRLSAETACDKILDVAISGENRVIKLARSNDSKDTDDGQLDLKILLNSEICELKRVYEEYTELSIQTRFKTWFINDQGELSCTLDNASLVENYEKIELYKNSINEIGKRIEELKSKIKEEEGK